MADQQNLITQFYLELEGMSGQAIAEIVHCPLKTVWTRLFHARREFLAHLRARRANP